MFHSSEVQWAFTAGALSLLIVSIAGCGGDTAAAGSGRKTAAQGGPIVSAVTVEGNERGIQDSRDAQGIVLNAVRVAVAPATFGTFSGAAVLTGVVRPKKSATVAAEIPGRVIANRCTVGRPVRKNERIYKTDTADLRLRIRQAEENLSARKTDARFFAGELDRTEALVSEDVQPKESLTRSRYELDRSRHSIDAAETALAVAEKALRDATVRAPFDGTISRCLAEKGDYVAPGKPVFDIVDLSEMRLEVGVPAALAVKLRLGTEAVASFDALGDSTREARLIETAPTPNPSSGTYPVRFAVANPDGAIFEGMTAKITVDGVPRKVLTIPREAVFREGGEPRVFVVVKGRAAVRPVTVGAAEGGKTEIVQGLTAGDQVVVDGMFALTDGGPVVVDPSGEEV